MIRVRPMTAADLPLGLGRAAGWRQTKDKQKGSDKQ